MNILWHFHLADFGESRGALIERRALGVWFAFAAKGVICDGGGLVRLHPPL